MNEAENVKDALEWGQTLNRTFRELDAAGRIPGKIDYNRPPKPDPENPGVALLLRNPTLPKQYPGGKVIFGDYDCNQCKKTFYMEIAINAKGQPLDSLGGVVYSNEVALCDDCSPI